MRLTRRFATPALADAGALVRVWMRDAGLDSRVDAVGNVIGTRGTGPALVLGSHIDTIRDAGRFDGPLGVVAAIAVADRLRDRELPFALEVVAFADEEGVRYGTGYLGSRAYTGTFQEPWLDRVDDDGVALGDAIRAAGGDPRAIARSVGEVLGYCEVHIEQGPVLEAEGIPVGVVTGIAGASRARLALTGVAGHAGCLPMGLRRDALAGAAELVLAVEDVARGTEELVATIGSLVTEPGAINVVPGRVTLTLDVRHATDGVRLAAFEQIRQRAETIGRRRSLDLAWEGVFDNPAVSLSPDLTAVLEQAVAELGHPARRLPSGAGHDAAVMSEIGPAAMLFVRCAGGVSHNPAEDVAERDVAVAIDVLERFVTLLAERA